MIKTYPRDVLLIFTYLLAYHDYLFFWEIACGLLNLGSSERFIGFILPGRGIIIYFKLDFISNLVLCRVNLRCGRPVEHLFILNVVLLMGWGGLPYVLCFVNEASFLFNQVQRSKHFWFLLSLILSRSRNIISVGLPL